MYTEQYTECYFSINISVKKHIYIYIKRERGGLLYFYLLIISVQMKIIRLWVAMFVQVGSEGEQWGYTPVDYPAV